jgi:Fe-S-cluster-containing hydrogenase component 2
VTELYYPCNSLREGNWFKLICGASFQDLPAVRHLTLAYTLAGADCIDVAADSAVIAVAKEAIAFASLLGRDAQERGFGYKSRPLLMVSLNDGEDPHFRKAEFNPELCPADCPRPCEKICPAQAIIFPNASHNFSGVIDQRCYGCGRCLPICPKQLIYTRSYVSAPEAIAELITEAGVDALEIHTKVGHFADFKRLWKAISPWANKLKLLSISCPDGEDLSEYLWSLYQIITPLPCHLVWQTDGRPMSGDIGSGATRAAVKLAQKVQSANLPGYIQLAGGTNNHTVAKLKAMGLFRYDAPVFAQPVNQAYVAGVAYGSYARVLLAPILDELEKFKTDAVEANIGTSQNLVLGQLEAVPELLWQAVKSANCLVSQLKPSKKLTSH